MSLVFVSSGWLRGELNPVKSLYKQTYTTAQRRERENRKQPSRGRTPPLFFLHSTGEYEHMISHMLTPPQPPPSHTHTHTDVRAHKSTVGCILDLPSPTSQPPLFKHTALTDFHMKRRLHRPTQSPLQSLKSNPPCTSPPHTPQTILSTPPVQSTQASAPSIALAISLNH